MRIKGGQWIGKTAVANVQKNAATQAFDAKELAKKNITSGEFSIFIRFAYRTPDLKTRKNEKSNSKN